MLTLQVGDELRGGVVDADGEHDRLQSVDGVHLKVDFLGLHLLLQERKGVDGLDHWAAAEQAIRARQQRFKAKFEFSAAATYLDIELVKLNYRVTNHSPFIAWLSARTRALPASLTELNHELGTSFI